MVQMTSLSKIMAQLEMVVYLFKEEEHEPSNSYESL